MSGTPLSDSTTQVNLASYGTGNPFSVGVGVSIVAAGNGIYGDTSQAWTLTNAGTIGGADAPSYASGATGVYLGSYHPNNRLTNTGTIFGGAGGDGPTYGAPGGYGVIVLAYATVSNSGTILGGAGGGTEGIVGAGYPFGGDGGTGLIAKLAHNIVHNLAGGEIRGGVGGVADAASATGAIGGDGIQLSADFDIVVNSGTIRGGAGGDVGPISYGATGGRGLIVSGAHASLTNHGLIVGGAGSDATLRAGYGGTAVQGGTTPFSLWNSGTIQGGVGGDSTGARGGHGGAGVTFFQGIVVNRAGGAIVGGAGDAGTIAGDGGSGISVAAAFGPMTILNSGTITGGASAHIAGSGANIQNGTIVLRNLAGGTITGGMGGFGGAGVFFRGTTFTNAGTITGGAGAAQYSGGVGLSVNHAGGHFANLAGGRIVGGTGGSGNAAGVGVSVTAGSAFSNAAGASIIGGAGDSGHAYGGNGNVGIAFYAGGKLTNRGTITGGQGGVGSNTTGDGGVGVLIRYGVGTLTNSGTISGSGDANAVQFGTFDDTLILGTGAVFNGGVDGGTGTNTMVLAGTSGTGTISGIGTNFTNFQRVNIRSEASWKMTGSNTFVSGSTLSVAGALNVTGTAAFDGAVRGFGTLSVGGAITIDADAKFTVYDLLLTGTGTATLNRNLSYAGNLTQEAGTVFKIADGKLLATSCMVDGAGTIELGAGSTFLAKACVGEDETVSFTGAKGWLGIDSPTSFDGSIKGFAAGDRIDLSSTDFAFGGDETVTFQENDGGTAGTLTVTSGADVFSVQLFGQYVASGFHLGADAHGGTLINYHPAVAASAIHDLVPGGHG
jgi:hypothetical protein